MENSSQSKLSNETSKWAMYLLPFVSALLGGGALWYTWVKYVEMANQSGVYWYEWTRPAFMGVMGSLCLVATLLFILRQPSGWSVFTAGLSMVPLMLFSNLVILIGRVIHAFFQGSAQPFLARVFTNPDNLVIPIIVIAFILLGSLSKRNRYENRHNEIG